MEFKTWYAVYYIIKKGLNACVITQWNKYGEIPDSIINSPDVVPRGGYMPLGLTGYICPLMAKEGEKALIYNNDGKYYFVDALTERLLAFYSFTHKNTQKITEVLLWKRIGVKTQKEIREIRNNFIKTHEKVAKKLEKSDIPIYADSEHDLDLGVFVNEQRDYSTKYGMKATKFQYTMSEQDERKLIKAVIESKFILKDMCDKFWMAESQAKIFLNSHGINHIDRKIFPPSLWKRGWTIFIGILVCLFLFIVCGIFWTAITSISILGLVLSGILFGYALIIIEKYVKHFMVLGYNPSRKHIASNIYIDLPDKTTLMK